MVGSAKKELLIIYEKVGGCLVSNRKIGRGALVQDGWGWCVGRPGRRAGRPGPVFQEGSRQARLCLESLLVSYVSKRFSKLLLGSSIHVELRCRSPMEGDNNLMGGSGHSLR